jgi:hypothetical protein
MCFLCVSGEGCAVDVWIVINHLLDLHFSVLVILSPIFISVEFVPYDYDN